MGKLKLVEVWLDGRLRLQILSDSGERSLRVFFIFFGAKLYRFYLIILPLVIIVK